MYVCSPLSRCMFHVAGQKICILRGPTKRNPHTHRGVCSFTHIGNCKLKFAHAAAAYKWYTEKCGIASSGSSDLAHESLFLSYANVVPTRLLPERHASSFYQIVACYPHLLMPIVLPACANIYCRSLTALFRFTSAILASCSVHWLYKTIRSPLHTCSQISFRFRGINLALKFRS
ncbi:predicted protein [Clavispora lusitaniae ATCC 42720]|uniref:Uncharacterized protein n=1 Tax=Clavispora lusitaniae (strain ATCC 42720) TaxID=306902 RepID=C4Y351_CLAL4|nr:uncharacterized protein CLUG_02964 [Clavispora lusitaniae ATCC 42720]EEQ38838.1 predicted protein [Clavispora lusitaniae ATCC 42720]